jgi:hypothetical protein
MSDSFIWQRRLDVEDDPVARAVERGRAKSSAVPAGLDPDQRELCFEYSTPSVGVCCLVLFRRSGEGLPAVESICTFEKKR